MLPQPMQPIRLLLRDAGVSMIFLFLKMSRAEQVRHREMKRPLSSAVVRESAASTFAAAPKEDRDPQEACYG